MAEEKKKEKEEEEFFVDNVLKTELDRIKDVVTKKDRDFVLVVDGEEGCGKSVLAMQIGKYLDPNLSLDNITFNATQFIKKLKNSKKFTCVILDEAFSAASSRGALSEVNKSMIGVATEMRQKNLFIIINLPTFFDLDRYFALWRCRALIHVYFDKKGSRGQYVIFPKSSKKYLYLTGKKYYNYSKPKSPLPACRFNNYYPVDEYEYRLKKAEAFRKRAVSNQARRWKNQRDALINAMYHDLKIKYKKLKEEFEKWGAESLCTREIERIVKIEKEE